MREQIEQFLEYLVEEKSCTPNTIAARNFIRMIAGGAAAHSDHGRSVAEVFLSAARKETDAYRIKDERKLIEVAKCLGVDTTVEVDGVELDRDAFKRWHQHYRENGPVDHYYNPENPGYFRRLPLD